MARRSPRPSRNGVSPYAINARAGARVSTNGAYLEPARDRPNLEIRGDAPIDRVLFEGGRRAVGVRARLDDRWQDVRGGTVLLCAGAVGSPAILQRSGSGPAVPDVPRAHTHLTVLAVAERMSDRLR